MKTPFIAGALTDKCRTKRNGKPLYVGNVVVLQDSKFRLVAQAYADDLATMRKRKRAIVAALRDLECTEE